MALARDVEPATTGKRLRSHAADNAAIARPAEDRGIWKLHEAIEFRPPAIDHAEFCYRRRAGDVAGKTQQVVLANKNGLRPSKALQEATLIMQDWDPNYCFWTLNNGRRTYIVYLHKSERKLGPHWRCWLGLRDRYEEKAIAFPIEDNNEFATSVVSNSSRQASTEADNLRPQPARAHSPKITHSTRRQLASQLRQSADISEHYDPTPPNAPATASDDEPVTRRKRRRRVRSGRSLTRMELSDHEGKGEGNEIQPRRRHSHGTVTTLPSSQWTNEDRLHVSVEGTLRGRCKSNTQHNRPAAAATKGYETPITFGTKLPSPEFGESALSNAAHREGVKRRHVSISDGEEDGGEAEADLVRQTTSVSNPGLIRSYSSSCDVSNKNSRLRNCITRCLSRRYVPHLPTTPHQELSRDDLPTFFIFTGIEKTRRVASENEGD
ncbi:MAG: hypothetical protein Q9201_000382 [Fulgogasparrea decipioides]